MISQSANRHFFLAFYIVTSGLLLTSCSLYAHPGSGIVIDRQGNVYFVHTGVGIYKVDLNGRLVRQDGPGYHFMSLDPGGRFAEQRWPRFPDGVIEPVGTDVKLLLASSFPLVIGPDGVLYYPEAQNDGRVNIMRLIPSGKPESFAILPVATEIGPDGNPVRAQWIHGLAAGGDGTLYYTEKYSVRRISPDGSISTIAENIMVPGCVRPLLVADERHGAVLRGLDVAEDGTIFVAASGCSALLKITTDGVVSVVLQSSDSWAPTGVVATGDEIYVLEFRHIDVAKSEEWLPRVRKISRGGEVSVIAEIK